MSNKNFNKKENKKVKEEALKSAEKPVDDFDKIPEEKPKFNLPLMMTALLSVAANNIKKEDEPLSFDGIIIEKGKVQASTSALNVLSETIKSLGKDVLHDLLDKKVQPEMIKNVFETVLRIENTELELRRKEKELEFEERWIALEERKLKLEKQKKEKEEA